MTKKIEIEIENMGKIIEIEHLGETIEAGFHKTVDGYDIFVTRDPDAVNLAGKTTYWFMHPRGTAMGRYCQPFGSAPTEESAIREIKTLAKLESSRTDLIETVKPQVDAIDRKIETATKFQTRSGYVSFAWGMAIYTVIAIVPGWLLGLTWFETVALAYATLMGVAVIGYVVRENAHRRAASLEVGRTAVAKPITRFNDQVMRFNHTVRDEWLIK